MAMDNNTTYNLTVSWGQYLFDHNLAMEPIDPPVLAWGWKATATIIYNSLPIPNYPTGWFASTPLQGNYTRIEATAYTWSEMSYKISALDEYWDPSNT